MRAAVPSPKEIRRESPSIPPRWFDVSPSGRISKSGESTSRLGERFGFSINDSLVKIFPRRASKQAELSALSATHVYPTVKFRTEHCCAVTNEFFVSTLGKSDASTVEAQTNS